MGPNLRTGTQPKFPCSILIQLSRWEQNKLSSVRRYHREISSLHELFMRDWACWARDHLCTLHESWSWERQRGPSAEKRSLECKVPWPYRNYPRSSLSGDHNDCLWATTYECRSKDVWSESSKVPDHTSHSPCLSHCSMPRSHSLLLQKKVSAS